MVTRMDHNVGRVLALLAELGLDEQTLVMFSSDNGPTFNGGTDSAFFESAGPFRGLKTELYEGGIRVPMVARWPGRITPSQVTDHLSAQWDVLPTVLDVVGVEPPGEVDGVSFVPTLLGTGEQGEHETMYWELGRQQAVRAGDWKLYRRANAEGEIVRVELYNLRDDIGEQRDLAGEQPEVVARLIAIAEQSRVRSEVFPSAFDAGTDGDPQGR
jgi:arylsulfatase